MATLLIPVWLILFIPMLGTSGRDGSGVYRTHIIELPPNQNEAGRILRTDSAELLLPIEPSDYSGLSAGSRLAVVAEMVSMPKKRWPHSFSAWIRWRPELIVNPVTGDEIWYIGSEDRCPELHAINEVIRSYAVPSWGFPHADRLEVNDLRADNFGWLCATLSVPYPGGEALHFTLYFVILLGVLSFIILGFATT